MLKIKNKTDKILPVFAIDLIEELEEIYKNEVIDPSVSRDESMYKAGQRSVIERLLVLKAQAEEEQLEGEMNV